MTGTASYLRITYIPFLHTIKTLIFFEKEINPFKILTSKTLQLENGKLTQSYVMRYKPYNPDTKVSGRGL